jgi:hypothetical protein
MFINIFEEKKMEVLIGIISGIVSGSGQGGGTILILCLSLFYGIDQHKAQATNLIFFVPTAISAIIVSIKEKNIRWNIVLPVVIPGIVGALIGAYLSGKTDVKILKKCFGYFLAGIAIYEIYCYMKKYIFIKKTHNSIK